MQYSEYMTNTPFPSEQRKEIPTKIGETLLQKTVSGKGNTEGKTKGKLSREERAYIAGFLDGDGCIMLQLIFRHDYWLGYQIRASVVFYQKQQNRTFLEWLKEKLSDGYIRNRNDGMSEYTIVGVKPVKILLKLFRPYVRLKRQQIETALAVFKEMPISGRQMTPQLLLSLAKKVDLFSEYNYSKKRTNTSTKVKEFLVTKNLLDPVETDS